MVIWEIPWNVKDRGNLRNNWNAQIGSMPRNMEFEGSGGNSREIIGIRTYRKLLQKSLEFESSAGTLRNYWNSKVQQAIRKIIEIRTIERTLQKSLEFENLLGTLQYHWNAKIQPVLHEIIKIPTKEKGPWKWASLTKTNCL